MLRVDVIPPETTFGKTKYKVVLPFILADVFVPSGFVSDGATVPRFLWSVFPPVGRYFAAAVVHDYLLDSGYHWRYANAKFKEALQTQGVAPWVTTVLYGSVQVYQFIKREVLRRA